MSDDTERLQAVWDQIVAWRADHDGESPKRLFVSLAWYQAVRHETRARHMPTMPGDAGCTIFGVPASIVADVTLV